MLTESGITAEINSALRAPWLRTVTMCIKIDMLLPAIETYVVLITIIPAAGTGVAASVDVDGASGGIVDGDFRGSLTVNVDGASVVYELRGAVWVASGLKLEVRCKKRNHLCE